MKAGLGSSLQGRRAAPAAVGTGPGCKDARGWGAALDASWRPRKTSRACRRAIVICGCWQLHLAVMPKTSSKQTARSR